MILSSNPILFKYFIICVQCKHVHMYLIYMKVDEKTHVVWVVVIKTIIELVTFSYSCSYRNNIQ